MRTKHAIKNISVSVIAQIIIIILGFISRKIFIDSLGAEYLGINGLLTNVLSMMVLIEGGIGTSIVYNLYKPLAEGNKPKIRALVQLYKKAYIVLAIIVLGISIILYPFLDNLMKTDTIIPGMLLVYSIFVAKNMVSYLNAYKWALINADQKEYVLAKNNLYFQVITTIAKIIILKVTSNYLLFLLIELLVFIVQNLVNTIVVRKRYTYIMDNDKYVIDNDTKANINKNVKAMFLHNIGGYLVFSTDNILMSAFISVKSVGLFSNYSMIINQLAALLNPIIGGIGNGIGNLIATEGDEKIYNVFKTTFLVSFWIYSFATIFLYNLLDPFINWWIGEGFLLDKIVLMVILINFYLNGMRTPVGIFKSKAGLFVQDKYVPVIEGVLNLLASLVLIKYLGLIGVFLGTTISTLACPVWNQARIVYKNLFKKPLKNFFITYVWYILLMIIVGTITTYICDLLVGGSGLGALILRGLICTIIPNLIYLVIFFKTEEFQYIWNSLKGQFSNIRVLKRILG